MISVLIPTFNYDVSALVTSLISQFSKTKVDFEIICVDDASTKYISENKTLEELTNVSIFNLSKNIGRSKIRNLLVKKAKYNWLLFLDVDVIPKGKNFIDIYLEYIKYGKADIYCGGVAYKNVIPPKSKRLRWVFGKKREEIDSKDREINPYQYFFGANILVHKSIFDVCQFNETLVKYGYEDVLFVENLLNEKIKIKHLNNEVYHLGIEDNNIFLTKTKQAIENLYFLNERKIIKGKNLKILIWYRKLERYKLIYIFGNIHKYFSPFLEKNLKSKSPLLFVFDIYKLTFFCYLTISRFKSDLDK